MNEAKMRDALMMALEALADSVPDAPKSKQRIKQRRLPAPLGPVANSDKALARQLVRERS